MSQTKAQRSAAAKKAAATRKKNEEEKAAEAKPGDELRPSGDSPLAAPQVKEEPSVDAGDSPQEVGVTGDGKLVKGEKAEDRKPLVAGDLAVGDHLVVRDSTKPEGSDLQSVVVQKED